MNSPGEVFRHLQLALDESLVDNHLCGDVAEFCLALRFHLLLHKLEVALHSFHSN